MPGMDGDRVAEVLMRELGNFHESDH